MPGNVQDLAAYHRAIARIRDAWPLFRARRKERLQQDGRYGAAAVEKVAEGILEDLFTQVLDWPLHEINSQVERSDLLLSRSFVKHLLIEVKRPGALAWREHAVNAALDQARRYADEQRVNGIAVSDGTLFYAVDRTSGSEHPRVRIRLDAPTAPLSLWWLCVDGIYREVDSFVDEAPFLPAEVGTPPPPPDPNVLVHPKYHMPAHCFAYVGDANDPSTWKLPCCNADGSPDISRLPKAIQSILSNYRGAHVGTIPDAAIPHVLMHLGRIAARLGRIPTRPSDSAPAYVSLEQALRQIDKLDEVLKTA
jgi:hypothetical protein